MSTPKYIVFTILSAFLLNGITGCSSLKKSSSGTHQKTEKETFFNHTSGGPTDQVLVNYIRTLPRLHVSGTTGNYQVVNQARATITGDKRPLFVIDGVRTGRDFNQVVGIVQLQRISSIKYITLSQATFKYGEEGGNGVVEIHYSKMNN